MVVQLKMALGLPEVNRLENYWAVINQSYIKRFLGFCSFFSIPIGSFKGNSAHA